MFANAVVGGVIARREKLDPVGFGTLAVLSGLGGGILRDVLLQHGPPVALTDHAYLLTAFSGAAASHLARVKGRTWNRVWPIVDAIALGCWASACAAKTLAVGPGWLPAVLLGAVTAVGGGAVRDIVLRRIPGVLGGNTPYATAAPIGAGALILVEESGTTRPPPSPLPHPTAQGPTPPRPAQPRPRPIGAAMTTNPDPKPTPPPPTTQTEQGKQETEPDPVNHARLIAAK